MEESSNGKIKETQKVDAQDEEKEVVIQDVGELNPEFESLRDIVVDGSSESVIETQEGNDSSSDSSSSDEEWQPTENSPEVVNSGKLEEEEEEDFDSVVESVESVESVVSLSEGGEALVENSGGSEDTEMESKEFDENSGFFQPVTNGMLKGIEETKFSYSDESNGVSPVVEKVVLDRTEEAIVPTLDENNGLMPNGIEETILHSVVENNGFMSKEIEETILPSVVENIGVSPVATDVVPKGIEETKADNIGESSGVFDKAFMENDDYQLKADAPAVDTTDGGQHEIAQSRGHEAVISIRRRTLHPTSWRGCCGLFDVLRRSDR